MLEPEAIQAAFYAAAGEAQALVNHLGLAARSAPTAKLVFETDVQAEFRRALQLGRTETVAVGPPLAGKGVLAQPTDVVVGGRTRSSGCWRERAWGTPGRPGRGSFAERR